MMTLTIRTGNAAFEGIPELEIARILRVAADRLEREPDGLEGFPLMDANGNRVGSVEFDD